MTIFRYTITILSNFQQKITEFEFFEEYLRKDRYIIKKQYYITQKKKTKNIIKNTMNNKNEI